METTIRLIGEVRGHIWMPNVECTKEFDVRLVRIPRNASTRAAHAHGWPWEISTLRDALLTITNDGDFQSCAIDWAVLKVTHRRGNRSVTRQWELRGKGENADCFVADGGQGSTKTGRDGTRGISTESGIGSKSISDGGRAFRLVGPLRTKRSAVCVPTVLPLEKLDSAGVPLPIQWDARRA